MPPPKPTAPIKLVMTTNSLRNNTISDASDNIYYEIRTEPWIPLHTKVKRLDSETREYEVKAEILRTGEQPEVRISERSKEWVRASDFLRLDDVSVRGNLRKPRVVARFMGDDGRVYRWQVKDQHLELFRADTEQPGPPLVIQHKHRRHFLIFRMSKHAWLEVEPEMNGTLDSVILSYLLIERKRRHVEKELGAL